MEGRGRGGSTRRVLRSSARLSEASSCFFIESTSLSAFSALSVTDTTSSREALSLLSSCSAFCSSAETLARADLSAALVSSYIAIIFTIRGPTDKPTGVWWLRTRRTVSSLTLASAPLALPSVFS